MMLFMLGNFQSEIVHYKYHLGSQQPIPKLRILNWLLNPMNNTGGNFVIFYKQSSASKIDKNVSNRTLKSFYDFGNTPNCFQLAVT